MLELLFPFVFRAQASTNTGITVPEFVKEIDFSVSTPQPDAISMDWSPDGKTLAIQALLMRHVTTFDVASGKKLAAVGDLSGGVLQIRFAGDGRVVVPLRDGREGAATLWDPKTGATVEIPSAVHVPPKGKPNILLNLSLDRFHNRLAGLHVTGSEEKKRANSIAVYDAKTWRLLADLPISASVLSLSPDGSRIAVNDRDGHINVISTDGGLTLSDFLTGLTPVRVLAWSADGERIATGSYSQVYGVNPKTMKRGPVVDNDVFQLWEAKSGKRIAVVQEPTRGGIDSIDFSFDGSWLATTAVDGACRIWDPMTLRPLGLIASGLKGSAVVQFSPDSRKLALLQPETARVSIFRVIPRK